MFQDVKTEGKTTRRLIQSSRTFTGIFTQTDRQGRLEEKSNNCFISENVPLATKHSTNINFGTRAVESGESNKH